MPLVIGAQQRDTRVAPPPAATGEITGIVWTADVTPQPMRRAVVTIAGGGLPSVRSVITDDSGMFTFSRLPAGTFTITAKKPAHLQAAYGSMKPGRPGTPIVLAAGQRLAVSMTMFKGAAISGALRDSNGLPVAGVSVSAVDLRNVGGPSDPPRPGTPPASVVSDDRGVYRFYGLMPGEYLISALPSPGSDGEIGTRSAAELDGVLSALTQRQKGFAPGGSTTSQQTPIPPPPSVGFAPIFFPGTAWHTEAAAIRVGAGEERDGVNFEVSHVRVGSIKGMVSGDVANLAAVELSLIIASQRVFGNISTMGITSTPPNARGEFTFGNMPPGQYRIIARARRGAAEAAAVDRSERSFSTSGATPAAPVAGAPPQPNVDQLFAIADVEVRGQDIVGLGLQLQNGGTLAGKLVFDAAKAPVPTDLSAIRIQMTMSGGSYTSLSNGTRVGNALSQVNAVVPAADGTFRFIGIGAGPYAIACQLPADLANVWKLRSAMVDGRDLLDAPFEGPAIQMTGVTLTLSDKRTELAGTLQSPAGQPATEYYVIAFSAERSHWRPGSRRSLSARPGTDGRFSFADLPAGEYFLAALTDLDPAEWQTAAFLEQVVPAGVKVSVGEGQKVVQDLRIR